MARQVHALAEQVRGSSRRVAGTAAIEWRSIAARRFRHQLAGEAGRVLRVADTLDEAACALARHAASLDRGLG